MVVDVHYQKIEPFSAHVEKAWKAELEIFCPHGNRIRREVFDLSSIVGELDSIAVTEKVREPGMYRVTTRIYPVPEEEKRNYTSLGWRAHEIRDYINNYTSLDWKVKKSDESNAGQDETCWYELKKRVLEPTSVK